MNGYGGLLFILFVIVIVLATSFRTVEQATVANTLARMQRDGLIERIPHPDDKRAKIITLTALGRSLEARAVEAAAEADAALFSGFKRFERDLMIEYMRMILENARKL